MLEINPVGPERYSEIAQIWNVVWPEFELDAEELRHDNEMAPHLQSRFWLASLEGEGVAFTELGPIPGSHKPGRWNVEIGVLPEHRRQGFGAALYDLALKEMGHEAKESVSSRVRDGDEDSSRFAETRGFREVKRDFQSVLDLTHLDPKILVSMASVKLEAVQILPGKTLDSALFRHQMHDLFERVRKDIPRSFPPTPLSFQDFEHSFFGSSSFLWEGTQIAMSEEGPVGFSTLFKGPQGDLIYQGLTAVDAPFRGKRVAQALKAHAMRWAIDQGFKTVRTDNDSRNSGMLAINQKLGFKPLPATITVIWRPDEQP